MVAFLLLIITFAVDRGGPPVDEPDSRVRAPGESHPRRSRR